MANEARVEPASDSIEVSALWLFPVKSLRGAAVDEAILTRDGFAYDRRWMVVDPQGAMLTQRTLPAMATIRATVDPRAGALLLERSARNRGPRSLPQRHAVPLEDTADTRALRRVCVWDSTLDARDAGPATAAWLSAALAAPCALVRLPEAHERPVDPRFARSDDRVAFADGYPLLLTSESSLAALNRHLETPVTIERFRGNIVLRGAPAWDEERWSALELPRVGTLRTVKPCTRCAIINVDPESGASSPEPLRALAALRRSHGAPKVTFGQNAVHDLRTVDYRAGPPLRVRDRILAISL